jgi:hypothetical protein
MKRKFFLERGNWEKAAEILQDREPKKFLNLADAMTFLKDSVLAEFSNATSETVMDQPEWIYGPILALPAGGKGFIQETKTERFERVAIMFWHCISTEDRSDVEIFETSMA